MKQPASRSVVHRLAGVTGLILFVVFMGNIVLAKAAMVGGFQAPRLSVQSEFLILLVTTLLAIIFFVGEDNLKKRNSQIP